MTNITLLNAFFIGMLLVYLSALVHVRAENSHPADFGKQWGRSHPFKIMGLTLIEPTFDFAIGFNNMRAWKPHESILKPASATGISIHQHRYAKQDVIPEFQEDIKGVITGCSGV